MHPLINLLFNICLFRAGPQDLPSSHQLMVTALLANGAAGVVMLRLSMPLATSVKVVLVDMALMIVVVLVLLNLRQLVARSTQTLTAIAGAGALLTFVGWPVSLWYEQAQQAGREPGLPALLLLALLVWNVAVTGHILRHALAVPLALGIAFAVVYLFLSMNAMQLLVPVTP